MTQAATRRCYRTYPMSDQGPEPSFITLLCAAFCLLQIMWICNRLFVQYFTVTDVYKMSKAATPYSTFTCTQTHSPSHTHTQLCSLETTVLCKFPLKSIKAGEKNGIVFSRNKARKRNIHCFSCWQHVFIGQCLETIYLFMKYVLKHYQSNKLWFIGSNSV